MNYGQRVLNEMSLTLTNRCMLNSRFFTFAQEHPEEAKRRLVKDVLEIAKIPSKCFDLHVLHDSQRVILTRNAKFAFGFQIGVPEVAITPHCHTVKCNERFYQNSWSLDCQIETLTRDCLGKIFSFLDVTSLKYCTKVSRLFRKAATQNVLWEKHAKRRETQCNKFMIRHPELSFYNQYRYYSLKTYKRKSWDRTIAKFLLKPEHHSMILRIFNCLRTHGAYGWRLKFKLDSKSKPPFEWMIWCRPSTGPSIHLGGKPKRRKISSQKIREFHHKTTLRNPLLVIYEKNSPKIPLMWITSTFICKFAATDTVSGSRNLSTVRTNLPSMFH